VMAAEMHRRYLAVIREASDEIARISFLSSFDTGLTSLDNVHAHLSRFGSSSFLPIGLGF
jgi:hypothetical protein